MKYKPFHVKDNIPYHLALVLPCCILCNCHKLVPGGTEHPAVCILPCLLLPVCISNKCFYMLLNPNTTAVSSKLTFDEKVLPDALASMYMTLSLLIHQKHLSSV